MRGRFLFLVIVSLFIWSCEDPTTLSVSKVFSNNKLQTVYLDTFSVFTSTVQLDSFLTNGTGTVLVGKYLDDQLGVVSSSSYFQVGYSSTFAPESYATLDSATLILPYNQNYSGDTSKTVKLNAYQLTEAMRVRVLPDISDLKISAFNGNLNNLGSGFFSSSEIKHASSPFVSATVKFTPHQKPLTIRLPDAFALKWFNLAKSDSGQFFTIMKNFTDYFFQGMHLEIDAANPNACIAGFNVSGIKMRFYYKKLVGDIFQQTSFDFGVTNTGYQFNHIEYDRSGTALASMQKLQTVPSSLTGNVSYVQAGTGLVTRLDFPSLKNFFLINNGIIINSAFLEIQPVRGSYPRNTLPPSTLQLYSTDNSNMPLRIQSEIPGAGLLYDYEFGLNTVYRFQLFPYLFGQLKSNKDYVASLILAPVIGHQGDNVQRAYLGDRFYPDNKIKLKIYYTYSLN